MITKKHSSRNLTVWECCKLEEALSKEYGLYCVMEVRFMSHRLQVVGRAYTCGDKVGVPPRHQALSSCSISESRPMQTVMYWCLFDLYCQAQNAHAAATTDVWHADVEELPDLR